MTGGARRPLAGHAGPGRRPTGTRGACRPPPALDLQHRHPDARPSPGRRGRHSGDPDQGDHPALCLRGPEPLPDLPLRIVVNHVLNAKRGRAEPATAGFACYAHGLDTTPDLDLPDPRTVPADLRLLVDEARISCTSGMLLCL